MRGEATRYDASTIQVLEGWEAVRKRPGMYIGSTGERGLHQMVFEVADRPVHDVLNGRATSVGITLTPDGGVSVTDDGPGLAVDRTGAAGGPGPALEALLTRMRTGVRAGGGHDVMLSFCGMGPAVVNALSHRMTAEVRREGVRWVQEYARGVAVTSLAEAGTATASGTTIAFWPDADIFGAAEISFTQLEERFGELAFLHQGLAISLTDLRRSGASHSVRFRHPALHNPASRPPPPPHPPPPPPADRWLSLLHRWLAEKLPAVDAAPRDGRPHPLITAHHAPFDLAAGGRVER
ncbi:hypothetical protein [Streptomyces abyssomicinicus]|uniref:hypothetical protein n=1 Tax=Streptomyces abyssomicinicus TaxID=574929 RepID=UPI00124FB0F3|nr:hypothetical protein [Streptomyces abyssomicinicus]